jgi:leucyl/phenylalanyl-tRNA--protein transferase
MGRRLHFLGPGAGFDFPPLAAATPEGLLAVGGDLRPERLLAAYRRGIFPWYSAGQPILWWSPDPRAVLLLDDLNVSRSLRKVLRAGTFRITLDRCFRDVMTACAEPRRTGMYKCRERQDAESDRHEHPYGGTWITPEMIEAYTALHERGVAHSVEAWEGDTLAGGLYGVALGGAFFGESMFTRVTDASKAAFVRLVPQLARWGFTLIDCQQYTAHLARFGAREIPRAEFVRRLNAALALPGRTGPWRFDATDTAPE